ncbi:hypothetical protein LRP67_12885 [Nocardioides sp. cx-169]|uniref:hypothetical protein n=1 Tax=Nocardioides sp. cx-169 TaxID=2899080 RepID=UPI001E5D1A2E|nr:hypothetical protein [Nocardioides sp. cx-169]MCD4534981.1 hypothetical protein [Nocardioides sp. cx-169]
MSEDWTVPAWTIVSALVVMLLVVGALAVATVRGRRRAVRDRAAAQAEAEALRAQVAEIERRLDTAVATAPVTAPPDDTDYVITRIGEPAALPTAVPAVAAPLFADLVLRESVVQAASLVSGLRRALAPEARHRIRFEMKREVKRSRKQRRADLKEARREWEARQRAGLDTEEPAA